VCQEPPESATIRSAGGKRPGCWSHARRRFVEAARAGDKIALEGVCLIAPIFAVERASLLAGDSAEQRRARRVEMTRPLLDKLRAWLDDKLGTAPPKSPLGKALGYLDRQWRRLILFVEDGHVEATNNRRERELRRLVLGRKNWLFAWGDIGGERTANILSIIATAISHNVNPRANFHLVARKIVDGWPQSKLRDLLPDRMLATHPHLFVGERDEVAELTRSSASAFGASGASLTSSLMASRILPMQPINRRELIGRALDEAHERAHRERDAALSEVTADPIERGKQSELLVDEPGEPLAGDLTVVRNAGSSAAPLRPCRMVQC